MVPAFSATAAAPVGVEPGQGSAIAQTMKIDPKAGSLSLGITFGQALAGHQNSVSQATSQAINLGVIGSTLGSQGCDGGAPTYPTEDQPQPLRVDSRDKDADKGKTVSENGGMFTKYVRADGTPLGEAVTITAPYEVPGVLKIGGGTSRTISGLVDGAREAHAIVDISGLELGGGAVKLSALHWEALYRSTGDKKVIGTFTIGSASIAGTPLPTNDPSATLDQANTALSLLGVKLVPGKSHVAGGVLFVDPLTIAVVPNQTRDNLAGMVLGAVQPVRQALFDALLAQDCGNATYITIFDLALGSVTGAGEFALSLGGAQASSSEVAANRFNVDLGDYDFGGGVLGAGPDETVSFDDVGRGADVNGLTVPPVAARTDDDGKIQTAAPAAAKAFEGTRGGALAGVALAVLLLLGALIEGDRRKMRHAQRQLTT